MYTFLFLAKRTICKLIWENIHVNVNMNFLMPWRIGVKLHQQLIYNVTVPFKFTILSTMKNLISATTDMLALYYMP